MGTVAVAVVVVILDRFPSSNSGCRRDDDEAEQQISSSLVDV